MHEMSIMESALEQALDHVRTTGVGRLQVLRLRVGTLSGVVPEALRFAFEALTPGTLAEGAALDIDEVPARFWCAACEREFEAGDLFAQCPVCRTPSRELRAGRELELTSLEIA